MSAKRYAALDGIRGFALLNMIVYHAVWDLVNLYNFNWQWYHSEVANLWQQFICSTFIFLSGFCLPLGKKKWKRGIFLFLAGIAVMVVTEWIVPENRIIFGILTLLGSCMLIATLSEPFLKRCNSTAGFTVNTILFLLTKHIPDGYIGFGSIQICKLPRSWYCNMATAYLGMPAQAFFSTDYFPLFPWIFLFLSGYFLYRIFEKRHLLCKLELSKWKPAEWIGRRSLGIYIIHQPILYLLFTILL